MADIAVFIVWDQVVRGRERRAIRVYNAVREYFEGLEKKGAITGFETGIFGPAAPTNLGGFIVVRGNEDQLRTVRQTKEFRRLMLRTTLVVEHVRVLRALLGADLLQQIKDYEAEIKDLED